MDILRVLCGINITLSKDKVFVSLGKITNSSVVSSGLLTWIIAVVKYIEHSNAHWYAESMDDSDPFFFNSRAVYYPMRMEPVNVKNFYLTEQMRRHNSL